MLPIEALAEVAARALNVLMAPREGLPVVPELPRESLPDLHAWESITRSRRPERPGVRALLKLRRLRRRARCTAPARASRTPGC